MFSTGQQYESEGPFQQVKETVKETLQSGGSEHEPSKGWTEQTGEWTEQGREMESGGGVLQAIGETIVEIGHNTTNLLAGQHPADVVGLSRDDVEEEKSYPGLGQSGEGI